MRLSFAMPHALAADSRSMALVDDWWHIGLLQQITAHFAHPWRAWSPGHIWTGTSSNRSPHAGQYAGGNLLKRMQPTQLRVMPCVLCRLLRLGPAHARHLCCVMHGNGDDSGMIKMAAQDTVLAPACAFHTPAAAAIGRLRNVVVFALATTSALLKMGSCPS